MIINKASHKLWRWYWFPKKGFSQQQIQNTFKLIKLSSINYPSPWYTCIVHPAKRSELHNLSIPLIIEQITTSNIAAIFLWTESQYSLLISQQHQNYLLLAYLTYMYTRLNETKHVPNNQNYQEYFLNYLCVLLHLTF